MTLYFDIGNSRFKWQPRGQFATLPNSFAYQKSSISSQLDNSLQDCPRPSDDVVIVSVAGADVDQQVKAWIKSNWGVGVRFLHTQKRWQDLQNGYLDADSLGSDRWYDLIGAVSRYSYPFIVVDIGSAVTVDVVNSCGQHLGGYISPGIDMMRGALEAGTDIHLDHSQTMMKTNTVPTDTISAINEGIFLSVAAFIDSLHHTVEKDSICILTGGGSEQIAQLMNSPATVDPNLIFFGIQSAVEQQ